MIEKYYVILHRLTIKYDMKTFRITLLAVMLIIGGTFAWAAKVDKAVNIKVGNKNRKYRLYVPNNVKENTALVFCLHGTGGSSDNKQPAFGTIADNEGIIVVYGHGENVKFPFFGNMELPGWNSTGEWSGDIDYIKAIIEDVVFEQNVEVGENRAIDFSIPDEWAEFNITFSKIDEADDIKITGIEIHSIDSNPDAINDIRTDAASHAKGIYNLNGIRTNHPTPGINIIDGKKVVIK